jgi:hypothetical protein
MSEVDAVMAAIALMQHVVDDRQWDRLDEVYTADGAFVLSSGTAYEGLENIRQIMLTFDHPLVHYTTNQLVDIDSSGTSARVLSKVLGITEQGDFLIGGYDDQLEKSDKWRVSKRVCSLRAKWSGDHPVVVYG